MSAAGPTRARPAFIAACPATRPPRSPRRPRLPPHWAWRSSSSSSRPSGSACPPSRCSARRGRRAARSAADCARTASRRPRSRLCALCCHSRTGCRSSPRRTETTGARSPAWRSCSASTHGSSSPPDRRRLASTRSPPRVRRSTSSTAATTTRSCCRRRSPTTTTSSSPTRRGRATGRAGLGRRRLLDDLRGARRAARRRAGAGAVPDPDRRRRARLLFADDLRCGETGASGLAGLLALRADRPHDTWERFGLGPKPVALVICTEAPTDARAFERITGSV